MQWLGRTNNERQKYEHIKRNAGITVGLQCNAAGRKETIRRGQTRPDRQRKRGHANPALRAMRLWQRQEVQILLPQ